MTNTKEDQELLQSFMDRSLTKQPRGGTPRTEKGTLKVNDKEVREEACLLLHVFTVGLSITDEDVRRQFFVDLIPKVDAVVLKMGLNQDRIKAAGTKLGMETINTIMHSQHLQALEAQHRALGVKIENMKTEDPSQSSDHENSETEQGTTPSNGGKAIRSTRGSGSLKREREIEEAEEVLEEMKGTFKKMKGDTTARSRRKSKAP